MNNSFLFLLLVALLTRCSTTETARQAGVQSILFTGKNPNQPLLVGLGGSEGGNAWATARWKKTRDMFLDSGYAFLAIGYFGAEGAPDQLDRIALEDVHQAIAEALENPVVDDGRVAVIGGSKGAELALLLASVYPDIACVVSIVGCHAAFPALTLSASTSSWSYQGKEVPFVPAPWRAVPAIVKRDMRCAFEIMLEDTTAVNRALIKVENIRGPILCLSATKDEMWPSTEMSEAIMKRLDDKQFPYAHKHIAVEGGHTEPLDNFPDILKFLQEHYPVVQTINRIR